MSRYTLRAHFTDGRSVDLDEFAYTTEAGAQRAAGVYMRDYSDPCGLGVRVERVEIVRAEHGFAHDAELVAKRGLPAFGRAGLVRVSVPLI